jgi:hypothetical protein
MLPKAVIERLSKVRIRGQALALDADGSSRVGRPGAGAPKPHRKGGKRK